MTSQTAKPSLSSPTKTARKRPAWLLPAAIVAIVIAGIVTTKMLWPRPKPPAGGDVEGMAKFVAGPDFRNLSTEQKSQYATTLRDKIEPLTEAFKAGKLDEAQYRSAMNAAWMGKQEEHLARYFALPEGKPRQDYLDHLSKKYFQKKQAAKGTGEDFKHDVSYEEDYISSWSYDKRQRYTQFRNEYAERRKALEASGASTKPAKPKKATE